MDEPLSIICFHCNAEFVPGPRRAQKYCSVKCHDRAADKRHREKHRDRLVQKSKDNYAANKEEWSRYRENQENKAASDPEYGERVKEWDKTKNQTYHKKNPGYNALKQENQKKKKDPSRQESGVSKPYSSRSLLATARLLMKESKLSEDLQERAVLQQAAEILTTTAIGRLTSVKR